MINRSVAIIKTKRPLVDWLKTLPEPADLPLEDLNIDTTAFLLPDLGENNQEDILAHYYDLIFEEQLMSWWTDKKDWPSPRDLEEFNKWFSVEFHSLVFDLVDEPLERTER